MLMHALKHAGSSVYGAIQSARATMYARGFCSAQKLSCRVVCVGNLTAGGSGKTPMIMYLARLLQQRGFTVVVLSRGYKGRLEQTGGLVSNGVNVLRNAQDAGDEPYLLACRLKGVPVYVGRRRYLNGLKAVETFKPTVILLDDGYQHLQLYRDFNLLLMDAAKPLDNGNVIPLGMLREKPAAINRAQAVVFTRGKSEQESYANVAPYIAGASALPHFMSGHKPYGYLVNKESDLATAFINAKIYDEPAQLFNKPVKVFAFAGIAKNQSFLESLSATGLEVVGTRFFNDHHNYTAEDLALIQREAREAGANMLAATEKDHAKLTGRLVLDLAVFGVQIDFFGREQAFNDYFLKALALEPTS